VIIGVLALIVVGPKDLPILMRKVGRFVAHMRSMAAEFRASFDEMARQSELDELRREVEALRSGQSLQTAVGLGPDSGVHEMFDDIHTGLRQGEATSAAPGASEPAPLPEGPPAPASAGAPAIDEGSQTATTPEGGAEPARAAL
jgi:sec-independent protein translocase protein TatB